MLLELDRLEEQIGYFGLVRTGRTILQMSHEAAVSRSQRSASDVLYGFDALYRKTNSSRHIGGWHVVGFEPGNAEIEKTTPHHCAHSFRVEPTPARFDTRLRAIGNSGAGFVSIRRCALPRARTR